MEDKKAQLEALFKKEKTAGFIKNIFVGAIPVLTIALVHQYSTQDGKLGYLAIILAVVFILAVVNVLYLKKVREDIAKLTQ